MGMLDSVDMSQQLAKGDHKARMEELEINMGKLQRVALDNGVPITIVFEGWGAAGKGRLISELLQTLDPRGVNVYSTQTPNEEEFLRPFLWRFWTVVPARGRMVIYDRSWYSRFVVENMDRMMDKMPVDKAYEEVNCFERQLVDDGHIIIKFFLHISREEQKKRFKQLGENPMTAWRVTNYDWKKHKQYESYQDVIEEMIARTDSEYAPWHVVPAKSWRFAAISVFETIIEEVGVKLSSLKKRAETAVEPLPPVPHSKLSTSNLSKELTREEYDKQRRNYQQRIWELEHEVYLRRQSVVIVYEGWDAAGKGGNIKRLVRRMDPRGYDVIPVAAPNDIELAHHYLWRFWLKMPKAGHFAIFDRSWYGRVLVERIEGLAKQAEWQRAYREINEMEEQLANSGTLLFKFWVDIDNDEQLLRFKDREQVPVKQWKITEEDWRNRDKWDHYREAVDEMLYRTDTPYAPWTIVESNCKWYARIKTMKTVVKALEKHLIKH
jgi:polyphosphate kinase 2 (PPK2 family)